MALAILNTSIITADGSYTQETITLQEAKNLLAKNGGQVNSAVGHSATAKVLTEDLGVEVPVNRQEYAQEVGETALVLKLNGRPEEGKVLTADEMKAIGYTFKAMTRTA